jgi:hypothetical protein
MLGPIIIIIFAIITMVLIKALDKETLKNMFKYILIIIILIVLLLLVAIIS